MDERLRFVARLLEGEQMSPCAYLRAGWSPSQIDDGIWLVFFMRYDPG